jgi:insulysin
MIEYYDYFILPASPSRSKLAIYLNAQTPAENTDVATAVENFTDKDNRDGEIVPVKGEINRTTPYVITDVTEFRSKMQFSIGPQPVKHISEFKELDSIESCDNV